MRTATRFSSANLLASCVAASVYADFDTAYGTPYYYVVRSEDDSGNGSGNCAGGNEDANLVERSATATGPDTNLFLDQMEGGSGNWTVSGTTSAWAIETSDSHSPTSSFRVEDPASVTDEQLTKTAALAIPPSTTTLLSFWHRYNTEGSSTLYDGGVLEYSTNGSTWNDILTGNSGRFLQNGYDGAISTCCSNPLGGRQAWAGDNTAWEEVRVDLSDFAGSSIYLRFRFGSDSSVADQGWWVDDVRVYYGSSCIQANLIFADGFESGDTSAWSSVAP